MKRCILLILILPTCLADFYIREGATGISCSDWANACDSLPAILKRGSTYWIADGSYGGYAFNDAESGTQYITIKKATASEHGTNTGWQPNYGDGQAVFTGGWTITTSYWNIDGQVGGGPGSWTTGHGFVMDLKGSSDGITFSAPTAGHIIKHIAFIYNDNAGCNYPDCTACVPTSQDVIYGTNSLSNSVFSHLYTYRPGRTVFLTRQVWKNITVEYSYFKESTVSGRMPDGSCQHGEIWSADHRTAGSFKNIVFRYNYVDDIASTGGLIWRGAEECFVYGNIFRNAHSKANGMISTWSDCTEGPSYSIYIFNNDFIDTDATVGMGCVAEPYYRAYNNLYYSNNRIGWGNTLHDYNAFDVPTSETNGKAGINSGIFADYTAGNFNLASATAPGLDLTTRAWWDDRFCSDADMLANTRGQDGNWDMGAYEYHGGTQTIICSLSSQCDDSNICTTDTCLSPGTASSSCQHVNNALSCNDGNACTSNDRCSSGSCTGTAITSCSMTSDSCCPSGCSITNDADCQAPSTSCNCAGCSKKILATACSVSPQCDGKNTVENIVLSSMAPSLGTQMTVTIDYVCWPGDNLALWYHNGANWKLVKSWTTLTGCDQNSDGKDGTVEATVTVDGNAGIQYVRAIVASGGQSSTSSCPQIPWGDMDDLAFTVSGCVQVNNTQVLSSIKAWKEGSMSITVLMQTIIQWKKGC